MKIEIIKAAPKEPKLYTWREMREHANKVFTCQGAHSGLRFVTTLDGQVLLCDITPGFVSFAKEQAWSKVLFIMMEDEKAVLTFG
jgi:hypothetical protein